MAYILWTHPEINALTECSIDWGYVITFHNRINDKNGQLLATGAWQQYVVIMKGGLWLNDRSFCALSKIIQFFHVLYRPLALNLLHAVVPQPCPKSTSNRKIQHSHTQQLNGFQCRRPRKFLSKVDHNLSGVIRPNVWSVAIDAPWTHVCVAMMTRCWRGRGAPITAWSSVLRVTCLTRRHSAVGWHWWCELTCTPARSSVTSPRVASCWCCDDVTRLDSSLSCENWLHATFVISFCWFLSLHAVCSLFCNVCAIIYGYIGPSVDGRLLFWSANF